MATTTTPTTTTTRMGGGPGRRALLSRAPRRTFSPAPRWILTTTTAAVSLSPRRRRHLLVTTTTTTTTTTKGRTGLLPGAPCAYGVFQRRVGHGRRARGGLAPRASRVFRRRSGPSRITCFASADLARRFSRIWGFPMQHWLGPPRARRPGPSRITRSPPPRRIGQTLSSQKVISRAELARAAASAAAMPFAHNVFSAQHRPGPPRADGVFPTQNELLHARGAFSRAEWVRRPSRTLCFFLTRGPKINLCQALR